MWRISFVLVIVGLCVNTAVALDGSGTEADPWRIESLTDFNEFAADANYWDDYTRLETDVNLAGRTYTTAVIAPDMDSSTNWFQGPAFTGVFDGNDHKLINLTINDGVAGNNYLGLFGYLGGGGEVKNLGLESGSIRGFGSGVGGLVGWNDGSVSNCYSTGDVSGGWYVGGLVGTIEEGSVSNCYSTVSVNGSMYVGGLVGYNEHGSVSSCYSTGSVSGGHTVGGLVGENIGSISNCYSKGAVDGSPVGGLVGLNGDSLTFPPYPGHIYNSYSKGAVQGSTVGGLVGYHSAGSYTSCFWDIDVNPDVNGIGNITDPNVVGLPTADMQTTNSFTETGWDFVEIWLINDGATYPVLRQEIRSDLNGDGGVDFADFALFADHWLEGKSN